MMINLEEFGELISKQEWAEKDGEIEYFNYLGKNKTYADDKFIFVSGEKRKNQGYNCTVLIPDDNSKVELFTPNIVSFSEILSLANAHKSSDGHSAPVSVYTYNNATEKDEETFQVKINDNTVFTVDKNHDLITDKKYFANEKEDSSDSSTHYEFHDYGIYSEEVGELKLYLLNDEKSCFPESNNIELSNIIKNSLITTNIPNLNNLSRLIQFFNDGYEIYRIEPIYDNYGLVKDELYCLYEAYSFDEFEYPVFASSMHPFYFDNFDTGILPGPNRYCVDQVDKSIDLEDNTLIYSREIYEIKDEERRKLQELILEAKEKSEPCIPVID